MCAYMRVHLHAQQCTPAAGNQVTEQARLDPTDPHEVRSPAAVAAEAREEGTWKPQLHTAVPTTALSSLQFPFNKRRPRRRSLFASARCPLTSPHLTLPHFDFVFTFKVRTDGRRMPRLAFRPCAEQEPGPSTRDKPRFHSVPRGRASVPPAVGPIEPYSSASRNNSGDQTQMTLSISRQ